MGFLERLTGVTAGVVLLGGVGAIAAFESSRVAEPYLATWACDDGGDTAAAAAGDVLTAVGAVDADGIVLRVVTAASLERVPFELTLAPAPATEATTIPSLVIRGGVDVLSIDVEEGRPSADPPPVGEDGVPIVHAPATVSLTEDGVEVAVPGMFARTPAADTRAGVAVPAPLPDLSASLTLPDVPELLGPATDSCTLTGRDLRGGDTDAVALPAWDTDPDDARGLWDPVAGAPEIPGGLTCDEGGALLAVAVDRNLSELVAVAGVEPQRNETSAVQNYGNNPVDGTSVIAALDGLMISRLHARARDMDCDLNDVAIDLVGAPAELPPVDQIDAATCDVLPNLRDVTNEVWDGATDAGAYLAAARSARALERAWHRGRCSDLPDRAGLLHRHPAMRIGEPVKDSVGIGDMALAECFGVLTDAQQELFDGFDLDLDELSLVNELDCAEPHDGQVLAIVEVGPEVSYEDFSRTSAEDCVTAYDAFVSAQPGVPVTLEIYSPVEEFYPDSDRRARCILLNAVGPHRLVGSLVSGDDGSAA